MKLNDLDLNKLAVFTVVARLGGVTKAANHLNLTPSAVSQSIKGLEEALDARLFDRMGKVFQLSPQGQTLFQGLERYQAGLLEALNRVRGSRQSVRGLIRLGVFYGFSNPRLAQFLSGLFQEHPEIQIDVLFASPSDLDRLLYEGRLDFCINLFRADRSWQIEETELMSEELWLVSAQKPPRRSLDTSELRKAPFIDYYRKGQLIASWTRHHFGKKFRDLNIVMHAAHSELVMQLILQGVGIGVVASSIAAPYVDAGRLFVIRGRQKQLQSPVWLKNRHEAQYDQAQTIFRKRLITHFKD